MTGWACIDKCTGLFISKLSTTAVVRRQKAQINSWFRADDVSAHRRAWRKFNNGAARRVTTPSSLAVCCTAVLLFFFFAFLFNDEQNKRAPRPIPLLLQAQFERNIYDDSILGVIMYML